MLKRKDECIMDNNISTQIPIGNISQFIQEDLRVISNSYDVEEVNTSVNNIQSIIAQVLQNDSVNSNSTDSDYHNLAVDISRTELYGLACDVLESGLTKYKSCDLLADFLAYGTKCGREARCQEIFKILCKMPKIKWNWRGYSFSIAYLTALFHRAETQKEIDKIIMQMNAIVEDFHKYIPNDEEAYICEANVAELCHEYEKKEQVLREALDKFEVAPKAALKLADVYADCGKYQDAIKMVERSIRDSNQTQASVSEPYLYYLRGLCKITLEQRQANGFTESSVMEIYSDFNLSLKQERRNGYRKQLRNKAIMLEEKTSVKVPDEYEELLYLIQS